MVAAAGPRKLAVLGASLLLSVSVAAIYWHYREPPPTVEVVDKTDELGDLLDARAETAGSERKAFARPPADREDLARIFAIQREGFVEDPLLYYRRASNLESTRRHADHPGGKWTLRTNSLGMRNDFDPAPEKPDLRVLVTGDSHTDGVCENDRSLAALLASMLEDQTGGTAEVLNAGVGGYHLYHYLGVLERYRDELAPDVFVAIVYGGNDFSGAQTFQRYFSRRPRWRKTPHTRGTLAERGLSGGGIETQELAQLEYFLNNPREVRIATETTIAITDEMHRFGAEAGVETLFVYLPPATHGQPRHYERDARLLAEIAAEYPKVGAPSERIADAWIDHMRAEGIPFLDLREDFRESDEPYYWPSDRHLNLGGHRRLAELLLTAVSRLRE